MKQTILGMDTGAYKKKLKHRILLCTAIAGLTLGLNILFTALRTDANHNWMLFLNIAVDILSGLFLLPFLTLHILPQRRLFRLWSKGKELFEMTVESISTKPCRYMDMDCIRISGSGRTCFLPAGKLTLTEGSHYTLSLVSNIVVEAEQ